MAFADIKVGAVKLWILLVAAVAAVFIIVTLAVVLTLPESYSCVAEDENYYVTLVDRPTVATVEPAVACLAQGPVSVVMSGKTFVVWERTPPSIALANETGTLTPSASACAEFERRGHEAQTCTVLTVQHILWVFLVSGQLMPNPKWVIFLASPPMTLTESAMCSKRLFLTVFTKPASAPPFLMRCLGRAASTEREYA